MRHTPRCAAVCSLLAAIASALIFFDPFAVYGVLLAGIFLAIALVGFFRARIERRRRQQEEREEREETPESDPAAGVRLRAGEEPVRLPDSGR